MFTFDHDNEVLIPTVATNINYQKLIKTEKPLFDLLRYKFKCRTNIYMGDSTKFEPGALKLLIFVRP